MVQHKPVTDVCDSDVMDKCLQSKGLDTYGIGKIRQCLLHAGASDIAAADEARLEAESQVSDTLTKSTPISVMHQQIVVSAAGARWSDLKFQVHLEHASPAVLLRSATCCSVICCLGCCTEQKLLLAMQATGLPHILQRHQMFSSARGRFAGGTLQSQYSQAALYLSMTQA